MRGSIKLSSFVLFIKSWNKGTSSSINKGEAYTSKEHPHLIAVARVLGSEVGRPGKSHVLHDMIKLPQIQEYSILHAQFIALLLKRKQADRRASNSRCAPGVLRRGCTFAQPCREFFPRHSFSAHSESGKAWTGQQANTRSLSERA